MSWMMKVGIELQMALSIPLNSYRYYQLSPMTQKKLVITPIGLSLVFSVSPELWYSVISAFRFHQLLHALYLCHGYYLDTEYGWLQLQNTHDSLVTNLLSQCCMRTGTNVQRKIQVFHHSVGQSPAPTSAFLEGDQFWKESEGREQTTAVFLIPAAPLLCGRALKGTKYVGGKVLCDTASVLAQTS